METEEIFHDPLLISMETIFDDVEDSLLSLNFNDIDGKAFNG